MKKILLLITSAGLLMACDSFKVKNATTANITVDDETVKPGHCVEVSDGFLFGSWPPSVRDTDDGTPHEAKEITGDAKHVAVKGFDENGTPQVEALQNPEAEATCTPATPDDSAGGGKPTDQQPTDQQPTDQQPTDQQPTDQQPTDQQPTDQQPTDQQPTDQQPTDQQPTDQQPTDQQPTDQQPTDQQ